jgi:hypothetical protein
MWTTCHVTYNIHRFCNHTNSGYYVVSYRIILCSQQVATVRSNSQASRQPQLKCMDDKCLCK